MRLFPLCAVAVLAGCGGSGVEPVTPAPALVTGRAPSYQGGLRLPVRGEWRVHRTHYGHRGAQAYAVDLVKTGERRPGGDNRAFPSYGEPIVADAPGVVAIAVDGIPDNAPGAVNGYDLHGNYVVIDHGNGEYSLFAHLVPGSLQVRAGQPVGMGQILGLCGNTGQSTMPHLHWQVMSHPMASQAKGLPVRHLPYKNRGQLTTQMLQKGDVVEAVDP
jgi:murein DD-endopeptidase MepM/ murein hydrolase activator NlpD